MSDRYSMTVVRYTIGTMGSSVKIHEHRLSIHGLVGVIARGSPFFIRATKRHVGVSNALSSDHNNSPTVSDFELTHTDEQVW